MTQNSHPQSSPTHTPTHTQGELTSTYAGATEYFDHEKLRVYQEAIEFVAWCEEILARDFGKAAVRDQLDRASTSIPLNIAEANGKPPGRDRARFLDIARGSALECSACLDVLVVKKRVELSEVGNGKAILRGIVAKLVKLTQYSLNQVREEEAEYGEK